MLTRLRIKRFKVLQDVDIELGETVVFIGPNNSGKAAAVQAMALRNICL
jgi:predicted ATPase